MIDKINRERKGHIITVEDPIEFIHRHQSCIVNQREVGTDTKSFANALKYALREDPDVILIGEMRDLETIQAALTIAETGHLALRDAAHELRGRGDQPHHRRLPGAPAVAGARPAGVRARGHRHADAAAARPRGRGRVMAAEILVATPAIRALIRDDKVHQIYSSMQAGKKHGMQTLNDALYQLYMTREVALDECLRVSADPNEFLRMIGEPVPCEEDMGHADSRPAVSLAGAQRADERGGG